MSAEETIAGIRAIFPVVLLFGTAVVVLVADLFRSAFSRREGGAGALPMPPVLHVVASAGAALAGVAILAGWDMRGGVYFDGVVRVDLFSRALSGIIVLWTLFTCVSSPGYLRRHGIEDGEFHALVLFGAGAMVLLAESNSLILVFLSLETFSMVVYILTGFTREEKRSVEGALKYLILGGFSSGFLLLGLALVYGATGEIRLDLMPASVQGGRGDVPLLLAGAALVVVGFGFKVGAFPFQAWIPDVYEGAPTLVTAFMSAAVKTAGFAAFTRIVFSLFGSGEEIRHASTWALSAMAIATMVFGNVVAIVQSSVKRMLAYSGIAHTGYLLMGLVAALNMDQGRHFEARGSAIVFYLLPYGLMTFGAFAILGFLGDRDGDAESFESFRGLSRRRPLLAFCMLLFMVSLAGIPPTAGFWAKLYLFREVVAAGRWDLALVGILTSILAVYYYLRLVVVMYMQPLPALAPAGTEEGGEESGSPSGKSAVPDDPNAWAATSVIGAAALGVLLIGIFPDGLLSQSVRSIRSLLTGL